MTISEKQILNLLHEIENGSLKITMRPNQNTLMGEILYDIENGWGIAIFIDCFVWDYVSYILDENKNRIYEYKNDSPISEYECSDEASKSVYGIYDPLLMAHAHMVNAMRFGEEFKSVQDLLADINDQQPKELKVIE